MSGPGNWARLLVPAVPVAWLVVFFLLPLVIVLRISLSESVLATPPYTPLIVAAPDGGLAWQGSAGNYWFLAAVAVIGITVFAISAKTGFDRQARAYEISGRV